VADAPPGAPAPRVLPVRRRRSGLLTCRLAGAAGGRPAAAVLASGWLPDFVRLGELERHVGDGVIEGLAEAAVAGGRMPARRRLMLLPLIMRLTVAMTLMLDASYAQVAHQPADVHQAATPKIPGVG
jgi:hypothetical protein